MDFKDAFFTPMYLFLFILVALIYVQLNKNDELIRKYLLKGLIWRFVGCIAFCLIFQFYYGYGDTFVYFRNSLQTTNLLQQHPFEGFYYVFIDGLHFNSEIMQFTNNITMRFDTASFFTIKLAALFNLFTFSTYAITSLLFSLVGFSGSWKLFRVLCEIYPQYKKEMAFACLFFPSIIFWGSGLMKDTICIGALGWLFHALHKIVNKKEKIIRNAIILVLSGYVMFIVKIYILLCFIPPAVIYTFLIYNKSIKNKALRDFLRPVLLSSSILVGLSAAFLITENDTKYNADDITKTAQITGEFIKKESTQYGNNGSVYDLGEVKFTIPALVKLIPLGIIVTLFRPFLWEIKNVAMLLSALESFWLLIMTLLIFKRNKTSSVFNKINSEPYILMALIFSLTFAFAIGISTNNFGTLVRYKLPMIPFYVSAVLILLKETKKIKN
jgi:hypothetical protein